MGVTCRTGGPLNNTYFRSATNLWDLIFALGSLDTGNQLQSNLERRILELPCLGTESVRTSLSPLGWWSKVETSPGQAWPCGLWSQQSRAWRICTTSGPGGPFRIILCWKLGKHCTSRPREWCGEEGGIGVAVFPSAWGSAPATILSTCVLWMHLTPTQPLLTSCENSVLKKLPSGKAASDQPLTLWMRNPRPRVGRGFYGQLANLFLLGSPVGLLCALFYHHQRALCSSWATSHWGFGKPYVLILKIRRWTKSFELNFTPKKSFGSTHRKHLFEVMALLFLAFSIHWKDSFFFLFIAEPGAYGSSRDRGQIGAVAANSTTACDNSGS